MSMSGIGPGETRVGVGWGPVDPGFGDGVGPKESEVGDVWSPGEPEV